MTIPEPRSHIARMRIGEGWDVHSWLQADHW